MNMQLSAHGLFSGPMNTLLRRPDHGHHTRQTKLVTCHIQIGLEVHVGLAGGGLPAQQAIQWNARQLARVQAPRHLALPQHIGLELHAALQPVGAGGLVGPGHPQLRVKVRQVKLPLGPPR